MSTATYPLKTISALLLLTDRRVNQLVKEGVIPRSERGRYELVPVVQAYIRYLKDRAVKADASEGRESPALDLSLERARLAKEQADAQELKNAAARGEMLPAAEVERAWGDILGAVRARMLAVPSRLRQRIGHLTEPEVHAVDSEIRDALSELGSES